MQKVNKGVGVEIVTHLGVGVAEAINFGPTCVLKGKRLHRISIRHFLVLESDF
jgi:hypothetical protein